MRNIVALLLTLILSGMMNKDGCGQLTDGAYCVQYDDQFRETHRSYKLVIKKGKATTIRRNEKKKYRLEWIGENRFRFVTPGEKPDTLDVLQKQLGSLGEPYYEITGCRPDTLWFTFRQNLHIVINSGVLIKAK